MTVQCHLQQYALGTYLEADNKLVGHVLMEISFLIFTFLKAGSEKKNTLYLSVNVFSTKVLIGDTIFTSPNGDGTAILRGHSSHAKVQPPAGQRFSVLFRPWVLVRTRGSNPRPPALQSRWNSRWLDRGDWKTYLLSLDPSSSERPAEQSTQNLKNLCTHMDIIVEKLRQRPLFLFVSGGA